jgi:magnesium-transporting ATPase (P-type)
LGDIVPADCILEEGESIEVDESALTGESLSITLYPGQVRFYLLFYLFLCYESNTSILYFIL